MSDNVSIVLVVACVVLGIVSVIFMNMNSNDKEKQYAMENCYEQVPTIPGRSFLRWEKVDDCTPRK